jgi:phage shock protein A
MGFFSKLTDQIKGIANDELDKHSDAGRTARQTTRDFAEEVQKAELALVEAQAQNNELEQKVADAQKEVDKYLGYAKKAKEQGNNDLALQALSDKRKAEDVLNRYQEQLNQFKPNLEALQNQIIDLKNQQQTMEQRTAIIETRSAIADAEDKAATVISGIGAKASMKTFDDLEAKVAHKEAKAAAKTQVANLGKPNDDKYAALKDDGKPSLQSELDAL